MLPRLAPWILPLFVLSGCSGDEPAGTPDDEETAPAGVVHREGDPVDISVAGDRLSVRFAAPTGEVVGARLLAPGLDVAMYRQLSTSTGEVWRGSLDPDVPEYGIEVRLADGVRTLGPFSPPARPFEAVPWVGGSVAYQIFPERFWNGDPGNDSLALVTDEARYWEAPGGPTPMLSPWDGEPAGDDLCCHQYFGGDLQGILDRLGHLETLGVTAVYLNPLFLAGSAHGYDTWDYRQVAPNFGDTLVLRRLVDEAHARGLRLIWDFVPNHVGIGYWAFQDVLSRRGESEYRDWFTFRVPLDSVQAGNGEDYQGWWGYGSLPELRTDNPRVMAHLLEVSTRWTAFGFDGIRVDVANELDNREEFFPAWRSAVKALNPEAYLLGEIWDRDPSWLRGDQFDALMNYPMGEGIVEPFARGETTGAETALAMAHHVAAYPEASTAMAFNLISSHDTDRLLVKMGARVDGPVPGPETMARHRLAVAVLHALPGMPVTFQGDECGAMGGGHRLRTRYPIQWELCDPQAAAFYTELASLKRETPALASSVFRSYPEAEGLLAFLRGEPGEGEVLAVFNNGAEVVTTPLPEGRWVDLSTGAEFSGPVAVDLGGLGWRYLVRR